MWGPDLAVLDRSIHQDVFAVLGPGVPTLHSGHYREVLLYMILLGQGGWLQHAGGCF